MTIHKEGFTTIVVVFIFLCVVTGVVNWIFPQQTVFHYLFYLVEVVFFFLIVRFFRVPKRNAIGEDRDIVSTADGKVVVIEEVFEPEYFKEKRIQVSVFMSPLNVHVNWYPISGVVKYMKHHHGKYLVAFHPKSSELNERTTVVVQNEKGQEVLIRQIAGAVARRIVCYSKVGDVAKKGKEFGIIKFGSRIDFFLPLDADIKVELEQKVRAQETIIASFC
ncbi:MAG: phosphatidylserine decarboxylase family protein [Bacteroidales bacterium]